MAVDDILARWDRELKLGDWWQDLIDHQDFTSDDFDPEKCLAKIPRTDIIASRVIREKLGHYLTFIHANGFWYAWNGVIHEPFDDDALVRKVISTFFDSVVAALKLVTNHYEAQLAPLRGSDDPSQKSAAKALEGKLKEVKDYKYYRDNLGSNRGVTALVRMIQTEFYKDSDYFDNDTQWLVTNNVVFDLLDTSKHGYPMAKSHNAQRAVSKSLDVNYLPGASERINDSRFMQFLRSSVKDGDEEIIEYLQMVVGAAFMGVNKLRTIINVVGPPSSGKSVFLETLFKIGQKGAGYSAMPDSRAIAKVSGQNWEQTQFKGRRIVGISEPSSKEEIDDDFLKRYTGDVWIETRNLREKSSGWAPQGVLFIASNDYLRINTRDKAIVDRVSLIEFPYEFVENPDPADPMQKKRDSILTDVLQHSDEKECIMMWILQGMAKFNRAGKGLTVPESIKEASRNIVSNGSAALRWIDELRTGGDIAVQTADTDYQYIKVEDAWMSFQNWVIMNGERSRLSKRYFEEDISKWYPVVKHGFDDYFTRLVWTDKYYTKMNKLGSSMRNESKGA